tara:strand:- start:25 stop:663 length:639 start_codon:yes stop_codon:yes gene_type:complete
MICQSCGANSSNDKQCEYCGSRIEATDISDMLVAEQSKKATLLELDGDLSYIFSNKTNETQITDRILEKSKNFLEDGSIKKAEFLSQVGLKRDNNNEQFNLLAAEVNVQYAIRTSGSVQLSNIKTKYISEAKKYLVKVQSSVYDEEKDGLYNLIDQMDGKKASQFDTMGTIQTDADGGQKIVSDNPGSNFMGGCATVFGWIIAGLIMIGIFL